MAFASARAAVFVFVHAGGSSSRVLVVPLGADDGSSSAAADAPLAKRKLLEGLGKRIDVASAGCADDDVRQRLLAIVESSFGDLRSFDRLVGSLLTSISAQTEKTRRGSGTWARRPSLTKNKKPDLLSVPTALKTVVV